MSLLTHRLVFLCVYAYCFIFWDLPGGVLAAPESALCGWLGPSQNADKGWPKPMTGGNARDDRELFTKKLV